MLRPAHKKPADRSQHPLPTLPITPDLWRKIATSIAVQDGQTVALGGLIKNEVDKGRSTIPLLGSIPILGHLFGDTTGTLVRTELIVLLTPHVVRTPVDAQAITEELKSKIEMAAPPPPPPPPQPPKSKKKSVAG